MTRSTPFLLCLSILLSIAFCDASESPPFLQPGYSLAKIPEEWIPANVGPRIADISSFRSFSEREAFQKSGMSIPRFIELFGLPDKYYTKKNPGRQDWDYLVYDLPGGYIVYLHASRPPSSIFGAAVAVDRSGKLIRLVK